MDRAPDAVTKILSLTPIQNSRSGNPRFKVYLQDHGPHDTAADSSFNYGIANREMRGWVNVWFNKRGEIEHAEPANITNDEYQVVHKALPADAAAYMTSCAVCKEQVRRVPGGNGPTWVHDATGVVAGKGGQQ
jgi:hypothetical protein